MTVICITHRLSTMRECNNIFHLVNGSIKKICDEHNIISDNELSKLIDRYKLDEKNKKVLITGADGFIGSHLTEYLVRQGYKVRAMCIYNSFNSWGWLDNIDKSIKKI